MAKQKSTPQPTFKQYEKAEIEAQQFLKDARLGFESARERGNFIEAEQWHDRLKETVEKLNTLRTSVNPRELLEHRYNLELMGESTVGLNIPKGSSRIALIEDVQRSAKSRYGQDAVSAETLEMWRNDPRFTSIEKKERELLIDIAPPQFNLMRPNILARAISRAGIELATFEDAVVCHVAAFGATGRDLAEGKRGIYTAQGSFAFSSEGLELAGVAPDDPFVAVAVALMNRTHTVPQF